jgi:hypothetical protein
MSAPSEPAARDTGRRTWEDRLAAPMFLLSVLFLVVLAGLIYRYPRHDPNDTEVCLILEALGGLWLVFLLEAGIRFRLRDRERPPWSPLRSAAACVLLPPLRMACRSRVRPNHVWLPGLGWQEVNGRLRRTLERAFSVPMIGFALLVLPLMALENCAADRIRAEPVLALWLDVGSGAVWLAFAVELFLMVSISDRPLHYCFLHWIDVVIVVLPVVALMPLFRLLRLGRILRAGQLLRWGRLYRLRALIAHSWRAFLLLQIVHRLTGRSLERQLQQHRDLLAAREEEAAELRREIWKLEERIARRDRDRKAAAASTDGVAEGRRETWLGEAEDAGTSPPDSRPEAVARSSIFTAVENPGVGSARRARR